MKNRFLITILLFTGLLTASAQQKIVQTQYFKSNPSLGGDVTIEQSVKETQADGNYTTFEINAPENGMYNLNMWILPSRLADGSISSYDVRVNGEMLKTKVAPESGNIQSYMLREKVALKSGKNTVSFISKAPEIAEIEFIRLSPSLSKAFISSEKFDRFMEDIQVTATRIARLQTTGTDTWENVSPADTTVLDGYPPDAAARVSTTPNDPKYDFGHTSSNFWYTYYRTVSLTAGQSFFIATNGVNGFGHILELFSASNPENYSWSTYSNGGLASMNLTVPVTGTYYVKIRSDRNGALGYVNININGQYYYENVPAISVGYVYGQDAAREYNTFTAKTTSDPILWIERYNGGSKIVAYNDDWNMASSFNWGRNSRIKKLYAQPVNAVLISAYGSSSPVGKCEIYIGCKNSTIYPYFPNLNANDAIMSSPASNLYNCLSWVGGITEFWEWPALPFSSAASFDKFLGQYRYPGCFLYSRSGATAANSYIDVWAIVNGTSREYTHLSVCGDGNGHFHGYDWESKPGGLMRTFHPRYALEGTLYGKVVEYYVPVAIVLPYSLAEAISDEKAVLENVQFSVLEKSMLNTGIGQTAISEKDNFESKYAAWKATWTELPYSDPYKYKNREYTDLLNYCKAHPDLNYSVFDKLGEGDFFNMLLVEDLTLVGNTANNQLLNNIKLANSKNRTTSEGATIVRSPYSNSMLYVKNLLGGNARTLAPRSIDGEGGNTTGISYSNTDQVDVYGEGSQIHIGFTLAGDAKVAVSVLELNGVELQPVVSGQFAEGHHTYSTLMEKPGIYLVRVQINGNVNIRKVTVK